MNTIRIGQQHYKWEISLFNWLNKMECVIYNIVDPAQCLVIVLDGLEVEACTPQRVKDWVNFALQQGWYSEKRIYQLFELNGYVRMLPLAHSLTAEKKVIEQLRDKFDIKTTSLEKSTIKYQLAVLEQQLGILLPTVLKQLYLGLGNGKFGPDYGFFLLAEDETVDKITLYEAYQEIHAAQVRDWDWTLSDAFVPFLYWGADIYSLLDCANPNATIYVLDMNLKKRGTAWKSCVWEHCSTMLEWLEKWLTGDATGRSLWLEMYQIKGLL